MSKVVVLPGASTKEPLVLYYRNGLDVFKHIFGNPEFSKSITYVPKKVYTDSMRESRVYTDLMTGDWAWDAQVVFKFSACVSDLTSVY